MSYVRLQKLIIGCIIATLSYADIPLTELSGMSTCMKPGYELYAPALGALYWYSPFVRNLYEYGPEDSAMVLLTQKLFFVHHDNITFDVTFSPTKIARYFEPAHIGQILAYIQMYPDDLEALKANLNKLITGIVQTQEPFIKKSIVKQFQETLARREEEARNLLEELIKQLPQEQIEKLQVNQLRDLITKIDRNSVKTVRKILKVVKHTLKNELLKKIPMLATLKETIKKEIGSKDLTNVYLLAEAGIKQAENERVLADVIVSCIREEQKGLYPTGTTAGLLLAWLWKHSNTKPDVANYLASFCETLGKEKLDVFDHDTLMVAPYTATQYEELKHKLQEEIGKLPFEELLFACYGYILYDNTLPPKVDMAAGVKSTCLEPFSDCGETSLRNFFNALLYNAKKREFDIELSEHLKAVPELIAFYKKYKTADKIQIKETHNDWATVVSGFPNVNYIRLGGCEIDAGVANMLKVIGNLIPEVHSFDDLKAKLEEQKIEIDYSWKLPVSGQNDKYNSLTIDIQKPGTTSFQLRWVFQPSHFEMYYPTSAMALYQDNYRFAIAATIGSFKTSKKWPYLILDAQLGEQCEALLKISDGSVNSLNICLLSKTAAWEDKIDFAKIIAQNIEPLTRNLIFQKIYSKLPNDWNAIDEFYQSIEPVVNQDPKLFNLIINSTTNEAQKTVIIGQILKKEIPTEVSEIEQIKSLYDLVQKTLPTIKDDYLKVLAMFSIFGKGISANPKEWQLLQPLYTTALQVLPTIQKEQNKCNVMTTILENNIPNTPDTRQILQLLYLWIGQTLPTLKDDGVINLIIISILNKNIPAGSPLTVLFKPLYEGIFVCLKTMGDKKIVSESLLQKKESVQDMLTPEQWQQIEEWARQQENP